MGALPYLEPSAASPRAYPSHAIRGGPERPAAWTSAGGAAAQPRAGRSTGTCGPRRAHTGCVAAQPGKTVAWLMIPQRLSSLDVPTLKEVMTAQEATPRDGDEQSAAARRAYSPSGAIPTRGRSSQQLSHPLAPRAVQVAVGRTTMRTLYPDLEEPEGGELTPDERALLREEGANLEWWHTASGGEYCDECRCRPSAVSSSICDVRTPPRALALARARALALCAYPTCVFTRNVFQHMVGAPMIAPALTSISSRTLTLHCMRVTFVLHTKRERVFRLRQEIRFASAGMSDEARITPDALAEDAADTPPSAGVVRIGARRRGGSSTPCRRCQRG